MNLVCTVLVADNLPLSGKMRLSVLANGDNAA